MNTGGDCRVVTGSDGVVSGERIRNSWRNGFTVALLVGNPRPARL